MFAIRSLLIPGNQLRGAPWINRTPDLCRSSLCASNTFRIEEISCDNTCNNDFVAD